MSSLDAVADRQRGRMIAEGVRRCAGDAAALRALSFDVQFDRELEPTDATRSRAALEDAFHWLEIIRRDALPELPPLALLFADVVTPRGFRARGWCANTAPLVLLDAGLVERHAAEGFGVLLHETVHASFPAGEREGHGERFGARALEAVEGLRRSGSPWLGMLDVSAPAEGRWDFWPRVQLTQAERSRPRW